MSRWIYNLLLPVGLLVLLPKHLRTMKRRGGYGAEFGQRFGRYRPEVGEALRAVAEPFWFHAVSVGEVGIAAKVIFELLRRNPEETVVLSTTTTTGMATARERLPSGFPVIYNPCDLPGSVRRSLDCVRPRQLVLTESELWPNWIAAARRRGIPASVINARLSPRSLRRYRRFSSLARPVIEQLSLVCAQEPGDGEIWRSLGARRVEVTGSVKFDAADSGVAPEVRERVRAIATGVWGETPSRILLLGSSHAGEEKMLAEIFLHLRSEFPDWKLCLVPRHAERGTEVMKDLEALPLRTCLRTEPGRRERDAEALVVDSTGELRAWYELADVIVIGKSFLAEGGQNPIEPILADRPVVCGPHMENFEPLIGELTREGAVWRCASVGELSSLLRRLMGDGESARSILPPARAILERHRGATARTVDLLLGQDVG